LALGRESQRIETLADELVKKSALRVIFEHRTACRRSGGLQWC